MSFSAELTWSYPLLSRKTKKISGESGERTDQAMQLNKINLDFIDKEQSC